jgi:hypothetical protein
MSKIWLALLSASLGATAAQAAPPAEWVGQAALPTLVIGFQRAEGGSMIVERIPPGEAVENWTRMVLNQRFAGVIARGGTVEEWRGHFMGGLANSCPGARASGLNTLQIEGRDAIEFRVDCPRNPATGRPETFLLRAIAGRADLHVTQVAFRHVPSAAEARWARDHLASVTLCTRTVPTPVCRAGPEAFDLGYCSPISCTLKSDGRMQRPFS